MIENGNIDFRLLHKNCKGFSSVDTRFIIIISFITMKIVILTTFMLISDNRQSVLSRNVEEKPVSAFTLQHIVSVCFHHIVFLR